MLGINVDVDGQANAANKGFSRTKPRLLCAVMIKKSNSIVAVGCSVYTKRRYF